MNMASCFSPRFPTDGATCLSDYSPHSSPSSDPQVADGRSSTATTPSPSLSPSSSSRSPPRLVPHSKALKEADAKLLFRSLVQTVERSRYSQSSSRSTSSAGSSGSSCCSVEHNGCSGSSSIGSCSASSSGSLLFGSCNEPCCRPLPFFAPEMLEGDRGADYDLDRLEVWSLGVVLYKLLTGRQPFEGKTDERTLQLIRAGRVRFPVIALSMQGLSLSGDAKKLIKAMLAVNPEDRISIQDVLAHPWLAAPTTARRPF